MDGGHAGLWIFGDSPRGKSLIACDQVTAAPKIMRTETSHVLANAVHPPCGLIRPSTMRRESGQA